MYTVINIGVGNIMDRADEKRGLGFPLSDSRG
jgi:hypothetical protein